MKKLTLLIVALHVCSMPFAQQKSPFMPNPGDMECRNRIEKYMSEMTLKEKVGQLLVYTMNPLTDKKTMSLARDAVNKYKVGAILFSDGTPEGQAVLTNYIQSISAIPVMMASDGEWGPVARLANTPASPLNAVLGCIEDNSLIEAYGRDVARQFRELGIHVNFAPVADVNLTPDNPFINHRSFGEDPRKVAGKVVAYARGLEAGGVMSVVKYFPGYGDTETDPRLATPILPFPRARLDTVELFPFREVVKAGLGGILAGHLKVSALEPDRSVVSSLSSNIINGLLKKEMGFKGLVFADDLSMEGVAGSDDVYARALKAGNDMILVAGDIENAQKEILAAVRDGELTEQEITEKCRKVLTCKYTMGLTERPAPIETRALAERLDTAGTGQLIARLYTSAITVLGNYGNFIPLAEASTGIAILHIGDEGNDDAFRESLQRKAPIAHFHVDGNTTDGQKRSLASTLSAYRRVLVNITEKDEKLGEYKELLNSLNLSPAAVAYVFFTSYRAATPIIPALSNASAVILAHSSLDDVQRHVADMLFAKAPAKGKLSMSIGGLFREGEGVAITPGMPGGIVPEDEGLKSFILGKGIDSVLRKAYDANAFPGCQVLILRNGRPVYENNFGTRSYDDETPVTSNDLYDLSSLSETTGTLLAVMKLFDEGKLGLEDKISQYLPVPRSSDKGNITIRELLFHESGLHPNMRFPRQLIDDGSVHGPFTQGFIDEWHYTRIGYYTYACSDFRFKKGMISETPTDRHTLHMADGMWLDGNFKNTMMQLIDKSPLDKKRYVYSEAGFVLLQQIIESISGMPLDAYLDNEFYTPMGLTRTAYLPLRVRDREEIAPASRNDYLRRQDIHGYVQNETAACLGGVAGNAGLFSTAREVAEIHQMLLNGGETGGKRYLTEETCRLFTTEKSAISHRGLGFDKPDPASPSFNNPCPASAPGEVYGCSGSAGTCAWVDPVNNFVFVFLSNALCPDVWNDTLINTEVRQAIQEIIYKSMAP